VTPGFLKAELKKLGASRWPDRVAGGNSPVTHTPPCCEDALTGIYT
jgi:hypothetical protein